MGELSSALSSGKDVKLSADVELTENLSVEGAIFDGSGKTLTLEKGGVQTFIEKIDGTIKNLTIDGEGEATTIWDDVNSEFKSKRGIFNTSNKSTSDVTIENVTFLNLGYAFNLYAVESEDVNLNLKDCTIEGWSSFTGFDKATFNGCKFKIGSYFPAGNEFNGAIRPYDETLFENCDFEDGFKVMNDLGTPQTFTFKNCKYNGVLINNSNVSSLLKISAGNGYTIYVL